MTTLRAYVDDKSLDLPLAQQNEALALIRDLKPIHEKLQAEEDAAAAVRVTQAKAQAEREAQERKARIREEKKQLKALDKQRIENLSEDDLAELGLSLGEAVADGAGPEVQAQLDRVTREWQRREKQQLIPTTDEEDLLTVLRRVKLPTRDDSGRGLQAELDLLRNEGVNFGTRQQLFDSKQGSLDRTAEKLRGEGFNQIQTPDDVIEFTKRALAGERILPQPVVDFARKQSTGEAQTHAPDDRLPHESQADTPDPFTAHGTLITGSRVTAAQAIQLAKRVRSLQSLVAQSDTGRERGMGEGELRDVAIPWLTLRRAEGRLINTQTGQSLPEIGHGVEAYVYEDASQGVVYKVYEIGKSDDRSIGIRLAIEEGMVGTDTGRPRDVIEKTWAINELGGTPTEIVGFTQDGEIVVKQPRGRRAQDTASAEPSPFDRAQAITKAHLQVVPSDVLPRIDMRSPLYYSHIAGQDVLLGDLHGKNFIGDTIGRGRINDLATHVLTEAELQKLPKLNAWIAERRSAARAQGSTDFARAWHGSPHRGIEKEGFKLQKIGTGEGMQAYGWGIYFADKREVSEWYKQRLEYDAAYNSTHPLLREMEVSGLYRANKYHVDELLENGEVEVLAERGGTVKLQELSEPLKEFLREYNAVSDTLGPQSFNDPHGFLSQLTRRREFLTDYPQVSERLKEMHKEHGPKEGQLYSADIPDTHELLDWSKPLSEHPAQVRAAAERAVKEADSLPLIDGSLPTANRQPLAADATGYDVYKRISDAYEVRIPHERKHAESQFPSSGSAQKAASQLLAAHGIPGLRYLDGNSIGPDKGTYNYVIWDEARLNNDIPAPSRCENPTRPNRAIADSRRRLYAQTRTYRARADA